MRKLSLKCWIIMSFFMLSLSAFADPRIDLYPKGVKFSIGQREFSNEKFLNVTIDVTAGGNVPFKNTASMKILLKNRFFSGYVYAPIARNGLAGGPIYPGETGIISLEVPLGFLSHCEDVLVHIDVNQNMQYGSAVYSNDQATFKAMLNGNRILCGTIFHTSVVN